MKIGEKSRLGIIKIIHFGRASCWPDVSIARVKGQRAQGQRVRSRGQGNCQPPQVDQRYHMPRLKLGYN